MLFRGQNILGYRPYADDVVEYFVQKSIANGIDIIRIFDCLNDIRNLQTAVTACNKENGHAQVALSYTLGDAYTLEYWMDMAKRVEDMGANSLCIKDMAGLFAEAGIEPGMTVGVAGWKMFTSQLEDNSQLFDVPCFIMDGIKKAAGHGAIKAASHLFIHPGHGARTMVNANEVAHYEFGSALASDCVYRAMDRLAPGMTEMEVAGHMCSLGQPVSVTTICAAGERFGGAVVFPRNKKIRVGHKFSLTMGLRGGLSSRAAYVAAGEEDMEDAVKDYVEVLAKPYYRAAASWYGTVRIGITGGEMYELVEQVLPKAEFSWTLNPGHLTADEEWMSSPIYSGSDITLKSGMMLQMDIIPGKAGYGGAGAEDGIVLADETLRKKIQSDYPETWKRFERRRRFMKEELGITLEPEVLPMSDIAGYMRPYLLNRGCAFKIAGRQSTMP